MRAGVSGHPCGVQRVPHHHGDSSSLRLHPQPAEVRQSPVGAGDPVHLHLDHVEGDTYSNTAGLESQSKTSTKGRVHLILLRNLMDQSIYGRGSLESIQLIEELIEWSIKDRV